MKETFAGVAVATMLALPIAASAENAAPKADSTTTSSSMNCPMMGGMQSNMGKMATEMNAMIGRMQDPSMKEHMQKMHDQMVDMMSNMGGMKGGAMMGGQTPPKNGASTPSPDLPDEHKAHHPEQ